ncbi:MAG: DNA replication and repair protein RecF, partial [Gammaproteobacteria bacterium]|nr:DNA replication and repair protein RecF [Gammaproteobacteria bacterium]
YGSTQAGPHRADLEVRIGRRKATEILSRGQEKLLVCALKVAQGELLSASVGRRCLYLVDDLPAELDSQNRQRVMKHLLTLGSQLFVTSVEAEAIDLNAFHDAEITRFHVERGTIST